MRIIDEDYEDRQNIYDACRRKVDKCKGAGIEVEDVDKKYRQQEVFRGYTEVTSNRIIPRSLILFS